MTNLEAIQDRVLWTGLKSVVCVVSRRKGKNESSEVRYDGGIWISLRLCFLGVLHINRGRIHSLDCNSTDDAAHRKKLLRPYPSTDLSLADDRHLARDQTAVNRHRQRDRRTSQ
jgi:hypothetical protein